MIDLHRDHGVSEPENTKPVQNDLRRGLLFLALAQLPALERAGHDNVEKDTLTRYGLALQIEVSEFLNETPWKAWKNYGDGDGQAPVRIDEMLEEFVDVLHFLGTWIALLRWYGIGTEEIAKAFEVKNALNQRRFDGEIPGFSLPDVRQDVKNRETVDRINDILTRARSVE